MHSSLSLLLSLPSQPHWPSFQSYRLLRSWSEEYFVVERVITIHVGKVVISESPEKKMCFLKIVEKNFPRSTFFFFDSSTKIRNNYYPIYASGIFYSMWLFLQHKMILFLVKKIPFISFPFFSLFYLSFQRMEIILLHIQIFLLPSSMANLWQNEHFIVAFRNFWITQKLWILSISVLR